MEFFCFIVDRNCLSSIDFENIILETMMIENVKKFFCVIQFL